MSASPAPTSVAENVDAVLATAPDAVLLVEGRSDAEAVRALARCRGRDLTGERVAVVPMDGITNLSHHLRLLGPDGADVVAGGLYDENEVGVVRTATAAAGLGDDPAAAGFHVCRRDLEDELIRALGVETVLRVFDEDAELRRFRVFQHQPAQRGRPLDAQVHRFLGIRSGRKIRYGRLLVEALDDDRVPEPLEALLARI